MKGTKHKKRRAFLSVIALCLALMCLAGCTPQSPGETVEITKVEETLYEKMVKKYGREKADKLLALQAGDVICFGSYQRSDDPEADPDPIQWIVLEKNDTSLFLVSKFSLDCQPYNTESAAVTWETCTLRAWLNDTFLTAAFSPEDQAKIIEDTVKADNNRFGKTDAGNDTVDKVFLLSFSEAERFFESDDERRSEPTPYAAARGVWTGDRSTKRGNATAYWWLRTPGGKQTTVAVINEKGVANANFFKGVDATTVAVRPAIRIDLASCPDLSFPRRYAAKPKGASNG